MNDLKQKWKNEYAKGGIPSSVRQSPSGSVVWAVQELKRYGLPLHKSIDIGCGKGRNSLYLSQEGMDVTAMDFTPDAVQHLQRMVDKDPPPHPVRALVHDVTENWPVQANSIDLAVDAFCFKHIAPHGSRVTYKENLLRVLGPRGHYMISFASIGDGYYGRYITVPNPCEADGEYVVVDPAVGIESVLYSKQRVAEFFGPELTVFRELHNDRPSVMHGVEYPRSTYALLFERNPRRR
ncbi:MAG: class I SAM-dependent methyltransferase [Alphaproteobacteria bacterium]|nr:class I SAM-dependent methyltransferase [Alphaproteobacteria bacterium]MBV8548107.1 class I SAM-dependent methyltransferase [Alphaproteobacteria bacterium]